MSVLTITARNVNDAYHEAMWKLPGISRQESSRNGSVLVSAFPVVTTYTKPIERMLWSPKRDANPFFHVMESLWMLGGRNKVAEVSRFAKQLEEYSDNGVTLAGAYGYRWRSYWVIDQISWVIEHLRGTPNSRRAVIAMWDTEGDTFRVDNNGKDVPCNTHIYFRVNDGKLDMTVCNRSNDVVWGCYGANAVHMSYLQEFVAGSLGLPMGTYTQFSNNWHIYERHWGLLKPGTEPDAYLTNNPGFLVPLLRNVSSRQLHEEITEFFDGGGKDKHGGFNSMYLDQVAVPMNKAWVSYKDGDRPQALREAKRIADWAVRLACVQWIERRVK